MQITVNTPDGSIVGPLEVPDDMELENFIALARSEIPRLANVPVRQLGIFHSGRLLATHEKSLKDCGVSNGDMVMLTLVPRTGGSQANTQANSLGGIDFSSIQVPDANRRPRPPRQGQALASAAGLPGVPNAEQLRQVLLADAASQALLRERNPDLAAALNDREQFERIFNQQMSTRRDAALRRVQMLSANPFDPEVQRLIEQEIQQSEIESHMEQAIEHMPETFGMVTMLYIRCLVNGHEVKAFVDSGAQATIMSEQCARRCNITRLIDRRFSGVARGVGTSRILGRIHMAQLQIENDFLPTAFNVLEDAGVDMLFGLDMLKRHQCIIDLQRNVLLIGTTGTTTAFLPESELPEGRHQGPASPQPQDRQLAEALERSAAEAEAASLSAAVAASNARRSPMPGQHAANASGGNEQVDSVDVSASVGDDASTSDLSQGSVDQLVAMGFRREDAIKELAKSNGDLNKAAMALVATSLPAPPPKKE